MPLDDGPGIHGGGAGRGVEGGGGGGTRRGVRRVQSERLVTLAPWGSRGHALGGLTTRGTMGTMGGGMVLATGVPLAQYAQMHHHATVTAVIPPMTPRAADTQDFWGAIRGVTTPPVSAVGLPPLALGSPPSMLAPPALLLPLGVDITQDDSLLEFISTDFTVHRPRSVLSCPESPLYESLASYIPDREEITVVNTADNHKHIISVGPTSDAKRVTTRTTDTTNDFTTRTAFNSDRDKQRETRRKLSKSNSPKTSFDNTKKFRSSSPEHKSNERPSKSQYKKFHSRNSRSLKRSMHKYSTSTVESTNIKTLDIRPNKNAKDLDSFESVSTGKTTCRCHLSKSSEVINRQSFRDSSPKHSFMSYDSHGRGVFSRNASINKKSISKSTVNLNQENKDGVTIRLKEPRSVSMERGLLRNNKSSETKSLGVKYSPSFMQLKKINQSKAYSGSSHHSSDVLNVSSSSHSSVNNLKHLQITIRAKSYDRSIPSLTIELPETVQSSDRNDSGQSTINKSTQVSFHDSDFEKTLLKKDKNNNSYENSKLNKHPISTYDPKRNPKLSPSHQKRDVSQSRQNRDINSNKKTSFETKLTGKPNLTVLDNITSQVNNAKDTHKPKTSFGFKNLAKAMSFNNINTLTNSSQEHSKPQVSTNDSKSFTKILTSKLKNVLTPPSPEIPPLVVDFDTEYSLSDDDEEFSELMRCAGAESSLYWSVVNLDSLATEEDDEDSCVYIYQPPPQNHRGTQRQQHPAMRSGHNRKFTYNSSGGSLGSEDSWGSSNSEEGTVINARALRSGSSDPDSARGSGSSGGSKQTLSVGSRGHLKINYACSWDVLDDFVRTPPRVERDTRINNKERIEGLMYAKYKLELPSRYRNVNKNTSTGSAATPWESYKR